MGRFFSLNSPIIRFLEYMYDLMMLTLLWIVCSIPIITIGTASSAVYYVTLKMVKDEHFGIIKSFFHAFKDNLRQGIILTVLFLIGGFALYANYTMVFGMEGTMGTVFRVIFLALFIYYSSTAIYTAALQAQFANTIANTLKSAFYLALKKPFETIFILAVNFAPFILFMVNLDLFVNILPFWFMLAPGLIAFISSWRFVKMFAPVIEAIEEKQAKAAEEKQLEEAATEESAEGEEEPEEASAEV